jgi:mycoredoxin
MATIRMYCAPWCGDCRAAERFLAEAGVVYEPVNIEEHPEAAELIIKKNNGKRKIPTFEVDGRWFALSPFDPDRLARELGLDT